MNVKCFVVEFDLGLHVNGNVTERSWRMARSLLCYPVNHFNGSYGRTSLISRNLYFYCACYVRSGPIFISKSISEMEIISYASTPISTVWNLCVLCLSAWVLYGYADFFLQTKDMCIRLFGDSRLTIGVNVTVLCLYMSALWKTGDQSRVYPASVTAGIGLQYTRVPSEDKQFKWGMDSYPEFVDF